MAGHLSPAEWRPDRRTVDRRAERLAARARREDRPPTGEMPAIDERPGHCWRCSHRTDNPERTCDFCIAELVAA